MKSLNQNILCTIIMILKNWENNIGTFSRHSLYIVLGIWRWANRLGQLIVLMVLEGKLCHISQHCLNSFYKLNWLIIVMMSFWMRNVGLILSRQTNYCRKISKQILTILTYHSMVMLIALCFSTNTFIQHLTNRET